MKRSLLIVGLIAGLALIIAACAPAVAPVEAPVTEAPAAEAPAAPIAEAPAGPETPFAEMWAGSGHAKADSEAFRHWDEDEPAVVAAGCVKCHAGAGLAEFLTTGKNETAVNAVDNQGVTCVSCHNDASLSYTSVVFPSEAVISGLGREAICMTCHQGRESTVSVNKQIDETFKVTDLDAVVAPISVDGKDVKFGFRNVHYASAAASQYGTLVKGGYEYAGKSYEGKFAHIEGYSTCTDCHNSHSLEVKAEQCAFCHEGVTDFKEIRMVSSTNDYDGDGDVAEGVFYEIEGLQIQLYAQLQVYAKDKAGVGVAYDPAAYPYWFADADGDGAADQADGKPVAFTTWTAKLLKAAYNYQYSAKEPGGYVHNGKYIVELLHDSIADLGGDVTKLVRQDTGHFDGSSLAFRDWDADGEVPYNCSKCHSATGLPEFIKNGGTYAFSLTGSSYQAGNGANEISSGFSCYTCHDHANWPNILEVAAVPFPSGKSVSFAKDADGKNIADPNNICLECHQGRQSGKTVSLSVAGKEEDVADSSISFQNSHYAVAGATLFGADAAGYFQYPNGEYAGKFVHVEGFNTCSACHDVHTGEPNLVACKGCHGSEVAEDFRAPGDAVDYDGDGTAEGLMGEVAGFQEKLYASIQAYATDLLAVGITYNADSRPYFFEDKDGDGKADKDDKGASIRYTFSPRLVKAAFNLHISHKDAGAGIHNGVYVMQALYDSIEDLGGDLTGMTRP